jgi:beta-galactosidase/beta-glucuronidase
MKSAEFKRETIDLSGFWHFKIDPRQKGEKEGWHNTSTLGYVDREGIKPDGP